MTQRQNQLTAMEGRLKAEWAGFREEMNKRLSEKMGIESVLAYQDAVRQGMYDDVIEKLERKIARLRRFLRYWVVFFAGLFIGETLMWLMK